MPNRKKIQLYRNTTLITPNVSTGQSAYNTAKSAFQNLSVSDGEAVLMRYQESVNDPVQSLLGIYHSGFNGGDGGWTYFSSTDDFYSKSEIDETDEVIAQALAELDGRIASNADAIDDLNDLMPSLEKQKIIIRFSVSNNAVSFTDESGTSMTHQQVYDLVSNSDNDIMFAYADSFDEVVYVIDSIYEGDISIQTNNGGLYKHYYFWYNNGTYVMDENVTKRILTNETTLSDLSTYFPFVNKTKYVDLSSQPLVNPTIDPYQMNDFGTINTTSFQVNFDTTKELAGFTKEYTIRFIAGQNLTNFSLPNGVMWANGSAPTWVSGHTYEISVVNNCAVVGEFY